MGFPEFAFAFFVFILLCVLIFLYNRSRRPKKSESDAIAEKEKRLFKLYQNLEDMMNGIEDYVEEARAGIAKDREAVSAMEAKIQQVYEAYKSGMQAKVEEEVKQKSKEKAETSEKHEFKAPNNVSKNELVRFLKDEGLSEDKIAKELGISKGEVALILGIKKS